MTKQSYIKMNTWFREHQKAGALIRLANLICTRLVYVCYPVLLASLLVGHDDRFVRCLVVPAVSFVLLSIVRARINAPRPYQTFGVDPLIPKGTKGCSFPSRHVFSAFVIAMAGFYANPLVGTIFAVLGTVVALCRVLGGVHFPKDVIAGALGGIICGAVGFYVIK